MSLGVSASYKSRLAPFWDYIVAMSFADPRVDMESTGADGKATFTDSQHEAAADICKRFESDYGDFCQERKVFQSNVWSDETADGKKLARGNLLAYYHQKYEEGIFADAASTNGSTTFPAVAAFARAVWTMPITTVNVESFFSKLGFTISKHRASLGDDVAELAMHCQDVEPLVSDPWGLLPPVRLAVGKYLEHRLQVGW